MAANNMDKIKEREARRKGSLIATMAGMDAEPETAVEEAPEMPPERPVGGGRVVVPPKKETRNKKVLVLLTPGLKTKADRKAKGMKISLNEVFNQLLAQWVEEE